MLPLAAAEMVIVLVCAGGDPLPVFGLLVEDPHPVIAKTRTQNTSIGSNALIFTFVFLLKSRRSRRVPPISTIPNIPRLRPAIFKEGACRIALLCPDLGAEIVNVVLTGVPAGVTVAG